jgi:isocitrate lyase
MAADVYGVPTLVIARTDAEAADLLTSDYDENDKPFLTGERTAEGFYKTKKGLDQAISRAIAYADYADLVWCETGTPDLEFARKFAEAVHAKHPGKMLAYNCSPSFNWKKNLDDATIAKFQKRTGRHGLQVPVHHPGRHPQHVVHMFDLAQDYVARGMSAYVEKVQEPEFAARDRGYTFVSHQQEVGTGYFDDVTTVIQGGKSSRDRADRFDRRRAVPLRGTPRKLPARKPSPR